MSLVTAVLKLYTHSFRQPIHSVLRIDTKFIINIVIIICTAIHYAIMMCCKLWHDESDRQNTFKQQRCFNKAFTQEAVEAVMRFMLW